MTDTGFLKSENNEYKLIENIGYGGYGAVYLMIDLKNHKK